MPQGSDAAELDAAATTISVPRVEAADSFVLHAPLELLARSGLLTLAEPAGRDAIRERMRSIAATYADWGTPLDRTPRHGAAVVDDAAGVLAAAAGSGDAEAADDAITWLTTHLDTDELVAALADPLLPSLAAAAHGAILLYLLPRVAARSLPAASMARTTVHELTRHPDWSLTWFDAPPPSQHPEPLTELERRLAAPTLSEAPTNTFIHPTMSTTERTGLARELLADVVGGLTVPLARRLLLRTAAQSMLQDASEHAPYGWSHCLTMPQATLGVAHASGDRRRPIAIAATYVLGFRASLGAVTLQPDWAPEPTGIELDELLAAPPELSAAAAWHTPGERRAELWSALATHAGAHPDAHLAKYTLACLDAVRADPEAHHLFLAAATFLNAWWNAETTGLGRASRAAGP